MEYDFNMPTNKYQTKQSELTEKVEVLAAELDIARQTESDAWKWINLIQPYADPTDLTTLY